MNDTKTGGPAFPHIDSMDVAVRPGMTLRDYFAAKILQGMYSADTFPTSLMEDTAREAYCMADTMLKVRNK